MKVRALTVAFAVAGLGALAFAGAAQARNPHCAGGIQYVSQALGDKTKGNLDDWRREIQKAIFQLTQCASEDPQDFEAMGYLGYAYSEADSAGPAGEAFAKSLEGLTSKGDKKKVEIVSTWRDAYWVEKYNRGVQDIRTSQDLYVDYLKDATDDEKSMKQQAGEKLQSAIANLASASQVKPGDVNTQRMLGTAYFLYGDFDNSEKALRVGLEKAPNDSSLLDVQKIERRRHARLLTDQKKYDEAIAYYTELAKASPNDPDVFAGLGESYMQRAQTKQGEAKTADWKASGQAYGKASDLKQNDPDMAFMAAQGLRNGADWAAAEKYWRDAVRLKPEDVDAVAELAGTLAELKKFDEAAQVLATAITPQADLKPLFQRLSAVYNKSGNTAKATEMFFVYAAMRDGTAEADAGAAAKAVAKAGTAAASTLSSMGTPDRVYTWTSEGKKFSTWVYLTKRVAFTFEATTAPLVQKSDWGALAAVPAGGKK